MRGNDPAPTTACHHTCPKRSLAKQAQGAGRAGAYSRRVALLARGVSAQRMAHLFGDVEEEHAHTAVDGKDLRHAAACKITDYRSTYAYTE